MKTGGFFISRADCITLVSHLLEESRKFLLLDKFKYGNHQKNNTINYKKQIYSDIGNY
uniref:Uncharacterized protein n=1 Tax=Rhizophagus irregularis (strain DAOM 181602 / DAOM 197198 / MUCL 43194) TaxID=747089 RepID=U9U0A0_RHIID